MAWRKPEARDLAAKLNQREMDAFKQHPDYETVADPVSDILELVAETVRGFCRSNKQVKMCPTAGTIPEGLMTYAMDFAAFDVLKRINVLPNEARTKAWENANELFKSVARGEFIPESYLVDETGSDTDANRAMPGFGKAKRKILNLYPMI